MQQWFVAKTKPHQETQASLVLERRGLESYAPLVPRSPGHRAGALESLFPGYLFARLDMRTSQWVEARSAPGVVYFLGGEMPASVPDELVEEIRQRVARGEYGARRPSFRPGERLRIIRGPLEGLEAVFDGSLSPSGRARVLVSMVSRLVPVTLELDQLRRVV